MVLGGGTLSYKGEVVSGVSALGKETPDDFPPLSPRTQREGTVYESGSGPYWTASVLAL